jgi:hypothetical protein
MGAILCVTDCAVSRLANRKQSVRKQLLPIGGLLTSDYNLLRQSHTLITSPVDDASNANAWRSGHGNSSQTKGIEMSILNRQGLTLTLMAIGLSALNVAQAAPRAHNAGARIAQGLSTGELTGREAARLNSERRALHAETRAYRADGHIDVAERKDLRQDSARLDRDIYNQKHDADTR